jgi:outer membrane protein OmpA-like peptidoglycan-associated protein
MLKRAAMAGALVATPALAQTTTAGQSFEVERLDLNPGAEDSLLVSTGKALPEGQYTLGAALGYSHQPFSLRGPQGGVVGTVMDGRFTATLLGAWSPVKNLEVRAQLPIVMGQTGTAVGTLAAPAGNSALGTTQLGAEYQFLQGPLTLAASADVGLPLGAAAAYVNNGGLSVRPRVSGGYGVSEDFVLGLSVGANLRPARTLASTDAGTQVVGSSVDADLVGVLGKPGQLRGEAGLRSYLPLTQTYAGMEAMAGLRLPVSPGLEVAGVGGLGLINAPGVPRYRAMLSFVYSGAPEAVKPVAAANPCDAGQTHTPAQCPALDDDADGIANAQDVAPLEAEDKDGFEDADGAPELDNDKDAVADASDKCANEAGVAEYQGCPVPDADKDGIADASDACVSEAGLADRQGCPFKDRDSDGLEDALDNCPDLAGDKAFQGCKAKQLVVITKESLKILDKVQFATGKATILKKSNKLLDQVAAVINAHPEIKAVRIEGHTDDKGKAEKNLVLSQKRADAVKAYLAKKGVAAERLESKGFGAEKPVAENKTPAGREQNRRVEFNVVSGEAVSADQK